MRHGGKRQHAGRTKIWDSNKISSQVRGVQKTWWTTIRTYLNSEDKTDQKFALTEINKLQVRAMTEKHEHTGKDGQPLPILIHMNVPTDHRNQKDSPASEET